MTSGYFGANEFSDAAYVSKGTSKRGRIVADTNVSPFDRARNICCRHKFCVRDTKNVSDLFRNILCPQQMFPSLRSPRNTMSNNVSATMCSRLPPPPPTPPKKSSLGANNVISFIHVLFFECCQAL